MAYTLPKDTVVYTSRVFIGSDTTIRRILVTNTKGSKIERHLLQLSLNLPLTPKDFAWTPPKLSVADTNIERILAARLRSAPSKYLGQKFPEFTSTARFLSGPEEVTMSQVLAGKKATILWFWNTGCGSCVVHMPYMERLYREFKDRAVNVIAVDIALNDLTHGTAAVNTTFNRVTMPVIFKANTWNAILMKGGGPFVLDSNGTVVFEGSYEIDELRTVLKKMVTANE